MILETFEIIRSEGELRQMCDCTIFGTNALQAIEAGKQLGLRKTYKTNLTIQQLIALLEQHICPIVYVELMPIDNERGAHALIVVSASDSIVAVLDPLRGHRQLNRPTFEDAFRLMNGLTIVLSR
ncbi:MAG: cysteine peptidase family C39 domain-containing protein [Cyanobacteria bacterium J06621_11]